MKNKFKIYTPLLCQFILAPEFKQKSGTLTYNDSRKPNLTVS